MLINIFNTDLPLSIEYCEMKLSDIQINSKIF